MIQEEYQAATREDSSILDKIRKVVSESGVTRIFRSKIDRQPISCIPITASDNLLLMHYFYDLNYDGYKILRLEDISEVRRQDSDRFYEFIIRAEGKYRELVNPEIDDLTNWQSTIIEVLDRYNVCMIECEKLIGHIFLGRLVEAHEAHLQFQTFDTLGRWDEDFVDIQYCDITCVTFNDCYTQTFLKYLVE